ncbi:hypothetical protein V2I01_38840 [Micromonospora sp. BRA006-A]|nr:hypothetical protein [Micromonospora sp. BRA006-A]
MHFGKKLGFDDAQQVIVDLLEVLANASVITRIDAAPQRAGRFRRPAGASATGYRVSAASSSGGPAPARLALTTR